MTSTQGFSLLFEGIKEGSATNRAELEEILETQCGVKIIEIEEKLHRGPLILKQSDDLTGLSSLFSKLNTVGGKVLLVNTRSDQRPSRNSGSSDFVKFYNKYTASLSSIFSKMNINEVEELTNDILIARERNAQIFFLGNGGSAATASHFANDFGKQRFEDEQYLFRAMSLNDNTSWLTATANDEGYDRIFVQQLRNLMNPGDLVIAISSSGNSKNVTDAVEFANSRGATTYGIVGFDGGKLKRIAKKCVYIPSKKGQYGYMEDITLIVNHIISIFIYEKDREAEILSSGVGSVS